MIPKSLSHVTDTLLMIEPIQFGFNQEASETNSFQHKPSSDEEETLQTLALEEFRSFVEQLRALDVNVQVFQDTIDSFTPDSIFPNNWISTHQSGELFTYPMAVPNRRDERRTDIIESLIEKFDFKHTDLSSWENKNPPRFLEGTGGMIFDRVHQLCYAAISPRAHLSALKEFCAMINYELIPFEAYGNDGKAIYHTNVMLSVGETFVCVGMNTIAEQDRNRVLSTFDATGKELIDFTNEQIYSNFAGNMLQVKNTKEERIMVLSNSIFHALTPQQKLRLEHHNDHLLPVDIKTIEKIGGGSVRCMLAEVFQPLE
ncbi:MAG: citrulline utilization hydrolase CtlX [Crocinitomicaceae bacterium]